MKKIILIVAVIFAGLVWLFVGGERNVRTENTSNRPNAQIPVSEQPSGAEEPDTVVPERMSVRVALLDTEFEGEPTRGCDQVVMVNRSIENTSMPLTAALTELFAINESEVSGLYNFIAKTNDTLSFDRATVENGTAKIYLRGSLSGLAGVCDDPRAQIQIEETALQFPTVDHVEIYLNGEKTDLTPSER